ncbi:hypothetical protein [Brumimicrobium mesophilum]|uniref:hypothetical protein n=1 Tax=Brumimicrobium mesophilum TaxID=392717 RepID=UPI000D13F130|nr:hypothetical protein [Brumimicrobium mesophilum]
MIEILFSPVNFALTLLVLVLVAYWLISIIGGLDFEIDFDVDVDIDADIDISSGLDATSIEDIANIEVNKEDVVNKRRQPLKWWQIFLIYFNFVGLPFMFTLTSFIFIWWIISVVSTSFFNLYETNLGFVIMVLSFIPALFITKIFTSPFKSFFSKFNKDGDAPVDFIGREGTSLSSISADKMGNAEVIIDGNPYSIYIKSENGEPIAYNENFLIIRNSPTKSYYYVQSYKNNY